MHQSTTIDTSTADARARDEELAAIGDSTSKIDAVESIVDKEKPPGPVAKIVQWVPTVLVMFALAGVGFVGHETGWRIPKFSELVARGPAEDAAWCEEHGVPEADCIACDADLMPKGKLHGWCKTHGVHECVLEHPETAQLKEPPTDTSVDLACAARALALKSRPENDAGCKMHLRRIQFTSKQAADRAGIDIGLVDRAPIVETIAANGEITYDPTQVARLSVRSPGTVWRVEKNIGDTVARGDVLALVDAAEVGRVKSGLLEALVQRDLHRYHHDRFAKLGTGVVPGRKLQETETALREADVRVLRARQALVNLGMPVAIDAFQGMTEQQLATAIQFLGVPKHLSEQLDPRTTTGNLIPVTAPMDGVVVRREVVAGEVVDRSKVLFTVVDTHQMWLTLDVPLEEAKYVRVGQTVRFRPDGDNGSAEGLVAWVSTGVDRRTRTVKVRVDVPNDDGLLRDETFGVGHIVLREEPRAIVVPGKAVHWEGCCHVVFVRDKDYMKEGSYKVFHTRSVRPGITQGDLTEIIAGVLPGEVIVTKGSGALRAELLKGNLGAG